MKQMMLVSIPAQFIRGVVNLGRISIMKVKLFGIRRFVRLDEMKTMNVKWSIAD